MSEQRFILNVSGIRLEIEGEPAFVQRMYLRVMRDLEEARARLDEPSPRRRTARIEAPREGDDSTAARASSATPVTWVHRCTPMVHKIYMARALEFEESGLLSIFDQARVATLYVDHEIFPALFPAFAKGQTLWAELTRAGKAEIDQASAKARARPGAVRGVSETEDADLGSA